MSTYSEIRDSILISLDSPTGMEGQLFDEVTVKMYDVVNHLASQCWPTSLLTRSAVYAVDSTDSPIDIASDLSITDMALPYVVTLDDSLAQDQEGGWFKFISYEAWLQMNLSGYAKFRPPRSFTVDPDNKIILSTYPDGSVTWDMYFWYYREVAAITDAGVPEIPSYFHQLIVPGVCLKFPQRFQAEKQLLYRQMAVDYAMGIKELRASRTRNKTNLGLRTSILAKPVMGLPRRGPRVW